MAAVLYPQADKPSRLSGGADAWDDGAAGVVLSDDYFGAASGNATTLQPTTGSVDIRGYAPALRAVLAPTTGDLTITGYVPGVALTTRLSPATGSVDINGYAPSIGLPATLAPTTGSVDLTGYVPGVVVVAPNTQPVSLGGSRHRGFMVDDYVPQRLRTLAVPAGASHGVRGYAPSIRRSVRIADSIDIEIPDEVLAAALDLLDEEWEPA